MKLNTKVITKKSSSKSPDWLGIALEQQKILHENQRT